MNPRLVFVASLFTSRIFWTQVIALVALVLTARGYHFDMLGDAGQAEIVTLCDAVMTTIFRTNGPNGPVSVTAPWVTPDPIEIPPGVHTVVVSPPVVPGDHPAVSVRPA